MAGTKIYGIAGAAVLLVGLGAFAWLKPQQAPPPPPPAAAAPQEQFDPMLESRSKGSETAPITMLEVSDFQCPYCRQFFDSTMAALDEEYIETGKVRFTFINLPIVSIHPNAAAAHEMAMCAAKQDQFWPMHDLLYRNQDAWSPLERPGPYFMGLIDSTSLDRGQMDQCLSTGAARQIVAADVQAAINGGLTSTPTFIIEGGVLRGAAGIADLRPILDSIYTAKTGR